MSSLWPNTPRRARPLLTSCSSTRHQQQDFSSRAGPFISVHNTFLFTTSKQVIESHYSKLAGTHRPMDIEWAKDGLTGELFIVQVSAAALLQHFPICLLCWRRLNSCVAPQYCESSYAG